MAETSAAWMFSCHPLCTSPIYGAIQALKVPITKVDGLHGLGERQAAQCAWKQHAALLNPADTPSTRITQFLLLNTSYICYILLVFWRVPNSRPELSDPDVKFK